MARRLLSYSLRPSPFWSTILLVFLAISLALFSFRKPIKKTIPLLTTHSSIVPAPPPHDASNITSALVLGKTVYEDTDWLFNRGFNDSHALYMYSMSEPSEPGYLVPRTLIGREAAAFISYVIDYYDALPAYSIFIHASDTQQHNDLFGPLNSHTLPHLRLAAIDAAGYVNLRCDLDPGCPIAVNPHDPTEQDLAGYKEPRAHFVEIYSELFNVPPEQVPKHVGGVCCAQFAVSRKRILERPKKDYERMMNWIANTTQVESYGVGWVFEKIWHVVFGMDATHCPDHDQCRCDLYGWCGPLASGQTLKPLDAKSRR